MKKIFIWVVLIVTALIGTILFLNQSQLNLQKIENSIEKGLLFLEKTQLPSGQFATYYAKNSDMSNNFYVNSPYITTFVVHSLNYVEQTLKVKEMKSKTSSFILSEMEPPGIWRFWGKNPNKWYARVNPDLDDTSCALVALKENEIKFDDNITHYLLKFRNDNGIFYTWMSEPLELNNDIDCVVNANVLFFYSTQNNSLDDVCNYLNRISRDKLFPECSIYYPSPYAFTYMLTRAYVDGSAICLNNSIPPIKDYILSKQMSNGSWGNELDTALATVSLLNIHYEDKELDSAISSILNSQKDDGSWPSRAFFIGPAHCKECMFFGSAELTTAINLEALGKYLRNSNYK